MKTNVFRIEGPSKAVLLAWLGVVLVNVCGLALFGGLLQAIDAFDPQLTREVLPAVLTDASSFQIQATQVVDWWLLLAFSCLLTTSVLLLMPLVFAPVDSGELNMQRWLFIRTAALCAFVWVWLVPTSPTSEPPVQPGYHLAAALAASVFVAFAHAGALWQRRQNANSSSTHTAEAVRRFSFLDADERQLAFAAALALVICSWLISDDNQERALFLLLGMDVALWSIWQLHPTSDLDRRIRISGWSFHVGLVSAGALSLVPRASPMAFHAMSMSVALVCGLWLWHCMCRLALMRTGASLPYGMNQHPDGRSAERILPAVAHGDHIPSHLAVTGHQQRESLATMSHELRTPLSCIVGLARLWAADAGFPADAKQDLGTVERMAVQLLRIVDDGLSYVQAEDVRGSPEQGPVRMTHLVRDFHALGKWLAAQQKNEFVILRVRHVPSTLIFDEGRTRQIIINLLSNAARFCSDGRISLGVELKQFNGELFLNWVVQDTGRGMDIDEQAKFFAPFTKSRDSTGLGLGLSLVRRMVDELGGKIEMRSGTGAGTAFAVLIPVRRARRKTGNSKSFSESGSSGLQSPSMPMDLRPSESLSALDFTSLRRFIKLGQLSEIDLWLNHHENLQLSKPASELLRRLRRAYSRVDLDLMQSIIDGVDTPLSFV